MSLDPLTRLIMVAEWLDNATDDPTLPNGVIQSELDDNAEVLRGVYRDLRAQVLALQAARDRVLDHLNLKASLGRHHVLDANEIRRLLTSEEADHSSDGADRGLPRGEGAGQ